MRFFHLSDLHLGIQLLKTSQRAEQKHILDQIVDSVRAEQPDALVIAGDVYDKANPSAEAVALFNGFITSLADAAPEMQIMIISGNHDSGERIDLYRDILRRQNVHVSGMLPRSEDEFLQRVTINDEHGPVNFYLMPYVRPAVVRQLLDISEDDALSYEQAVAALIERENVDPSERSVLVSHQFYVPAGKTAEDMNMEREQSEQPPRVGNIDAVSASVLEPFTYSALGHLHRPMNVGNKARYCGTPLQYSLSEAGQDKSITVVELNEHGADPVVTRTKLKPLRQVIRIKGTLEDVLKEPNSVDYVHITLTDTDILDRKETFDRLSRSFPYMLGWLQTRDTENDLPELSPTAQAVREQSTLEVCLSFLDDDVTDEERALLEEIIGGLE